MKNQPIGFRRQLFICAGKSCALKSAPAAEAEAAKQFFKQKIHDAGLKSQVRACTASCFDRCDFGPNMLFYPEGTWYSAVEEKDWEEIWKKLIAPPS